MGARGHDHRSLQADMRAELGDLDRAVASATPDARRGLTTELRRQVASAGLGQAPMARRTKLAPIPASSDVEQGPEAMPDGRLGDLGALGKVVTFTASRWPYCSPGGSIGDGSPGPSNLSFRVAARCFKIAHGRLLD